MDKITADNPIEKKLGQAFTFSSLLVYTLPSIFSYIFMGLYQTVDGLFIDHCAGEIAIAAVNLQMPMNCLYIGLGNMLGIGGDAVISRKIGEGDITGANETFTRCICLGCVLSLLCTLVSLLIAEPIMQLLGASAANIAYLRPYYLWLAAFAPSMLLQSEIAIFFMTEGKNSTGALLTVIGGILNCVLDWFFLVILDLGIVGAAIATGLGYSVTLIYASWYYLFSSKSGLKLVKCRRTDVRELITLCFNGSSDMLVEFNSGITTIMMNRMMFSLMGDNGVSALSVIVYYQLIILYAYSGFCSAVEPIFGYQLGRRDQTMLNRIMCLCLRITALLTTICLLAVYLFRSPSMAIFFNSGDEIYETSLHGYSLFLLGCLFAGFTNLIISFFTSMGKGLISMILSLFQGLLLFAAAMNILPRFMGNDGAWLSWPVAEFFALLISAGVYMIYNHGIRIRLK